MFSVKCNIPLFLRPIYKYYSLNVRKPFQPFRIEFVYPAQVKTMKSILL